MSNNPVTAGARSYHGTTTVGNVDVITLDGYYARVRVICHDPSTPAYATCDGATTRAPLTPTVAGPGTFYIPYGDGSDVLTDAYSNSPTVVRVVSAAAVSYSVIGL